MAMTISEATDVSVLLHTLNGDPRHYPEDVAEAAQRLTGRVHAALQAAPIVDPSQVVASVGRIRS
jgi:hypothetical protein